jgi:hypothetical protein
VRQKRVGVEMKNYLVMASMIMFVFAAQGFGFALGAEQAAANDSINASQMNETLKNTTLINETLENVTIINGTLENVTIINGKLENVTIINETLENASLSQNESDPFTNAKNRKPSSR